MSAVAEFSDLRLRIKSEYKIGNFRPLLLRGARRLAVLLKHRDVRKDIPEWVRLHAAATNAEIFDAFGRLREARAAVGEGEQVLAVLPASLPDTATNRDRALIRERMRYCLDYAHVHHYRSAHNREAQEVFLRCYELLNTGGLAVDSFPCNGTLAQTHFYMGRMWRQVGEFSQARVSFGKCLEYLHRKAKAESASGNAVRVRAELAAAHYKAALCYSFGLAWVDYSTGALTQARQQLQPARLLLLSTGDELNREYVELMAAAIDGTLAGSDRAQLDRVIARLDAVLATFRRHRHPRYVARARYELGVVHLGRGNAAAASACADAVMSYANTRSAVWHCRAQLLRSRIKAKLERDFVGAERDARAALQQAEAHHLLVDTIEALACIGEAVFEQGRNDMAEQHLREALQKCAGLGKDVGGPVNGRLEATCRLQFARLAQRRGLFTESLEHLKRAKDALTTVENGALEEAARRLTQELENRPDFIIANSSSSLSKYRFYEAALKDYLMCVAENSPEFSSIHKRAKALGIDRTTWHVWRKRLAAQRAGWQHELASPTLPLAVAHFLRQAAPRRERTRRPAR